MSNAGTNPDLLALDDVRQSIDFVASAADELEQHRRWFRRYVAEERKRRRLHDRRMRRQAALIEWRERRRRVVQSMQRAGVATENATRATISGLARAGVVTLAYGRQTTQHARMLCKATLVSGTRGVALARAATRDISRAGVAASLAGGGWLHGKADSALIGARKGFVLARHWAEAKRSALMPKLHDSRRMLGDFAQACLAAATVHADAYRRQAALLAASVPKRAAHVVERGKIVVGETARWLALSQARARIALMKSWHRAKSTVAPMLPATRIEVRAEPPAAPTRHKNEIAPRRSTQIACVEPWRCRLPTVVTRQPSSEMRAAH